MSPQGKLTATVGTANAHYSTRVPKEGEAEGVESFVSTIRYRSTDNWPTVIDFEIGSDEALVYIYAGKCGARSMFACWRAVGGLANTLACLLRSDAIIRGW